MTKQVYYAVYYDKPDMMHLCGTCLDAYKDAMLQFATNTDTQHITIWRCVGGSLRGTLVRAYTREDFNTVRVLRVARDGVSRTETAIMEKL